VVDSLDPEELASLQNWVEFEGFTNRIFSSFGYSTVRNFRFKRPRMEVDLIASGNGITFAVDCKHWKRTVGNASMTKIAEKQALRASRMASEGIFQKVMPVILTWRDESLFILKNGVPVVPIHRLTDFLLNWDESSYEILIFKSDVVQTSLRSV
jgi:Holliday junction resolvase-like predicted endonuclease